MAHTLGWGHADVNAGLLESPNQTQVIGTSGLAEGSKGSGELLDPAHQQGKAIGIIGELAVGCAEVAIKGGLGNIDSKVVKRVGHEVYSFLCYELVS